MKNEKKFNPELLDEFVITEYLGFNDLYVINATDKAYDLIGLKEKVRINEKKFAFDSIDSWYYIVACLHFIKNNYCINGLVRVSDGNTHDASEETEVTIFNDGGVFKAELDEYKTEKGSLFYKKPVIINYDEITEDIIENWADLYDLSFNGELKRLIFCSSGSEKFIYRFERTRALKKASGKKSKLLYFNKMYLIKVTDHKSWPIHWHRNV